MYFIACIKTKSGEVIFEDWHYYDREEAYKASLRLMKEHDGEPFIEEVKEA